MSKLVHWEIPSNDLAKSKEFYEKLFGWKFQQWSEDYALFDAKGAVSGALMKVESLPEPGTGIRVYVGVEDLPATLARVEELGGKTQQQKSDIGGGMGFAGSFTDPCGCLIGLWSEK